ncbi:MAG: hypothetical protein DRI34_11785 [Deltaproteobacteria bacterium]|nr:MAG: hypothetical protein DRI34_11785 [Deltaproteobacteria bacterium]
MEFLAGTAPFDTLPAEAREQLASATRARPHPAGEAVLERGQTGQSLFVVARGQVEVLLQTADGQQSLGRLQPGEYFGEIALMTSSRRTATIRAISDCLVLEIPAEPLEQLFIQYPEFKQAIARTGARRSQESLQKMLGQ